MSSKTIDDLRDHLFAVIQGVRDGKVTVEQARTIGGLSQVIVNTAKVEVEFLRTTERTDSPFLGATAAQTSQLSQPATTADGKPLPNGIASVTRHLLR
jgi:hypothetical protein